MRKLLALLLCALFFTGCAMRADAGRLRIHGVTVDSVQPGAGWGGVANTTVPAQQGNPAHYGYADAVIARWDTVPFQTIGAGETLWLGVLAFHSPTDADYGAGVTSNVAYCQVAVDGGAWVSQSAFSTNPQTGVSEYLFRVNANDYATDGQHEARAQCVPTTGAPIVLQGPLGTGGFNGSISGTTLTVINAISGGQIRVGQSIMGVGIANNTRITALGTGTGDAGTYTLSSNNGTITAETMNYGDAPSLLFSTNKNATLPATKIYVSATGNDANPGTSASPVLTVQHAYDLVHGVQADVGGAFICMQAGSYLLGSGSGAGYSSATRWLNVQNTNLAPCNGVGAGTVTFTTGDGFETAKQHLRGVTLKAQFLTNNNPGDASFWLEGSAFIGKGMNATTDLQVFSNARGGGYCTETTVTANENGCLFAQLNRNVSLSHISSDAFQYSRMVVNSTAASVSPLIGSGTTTNGSKIVTGFPDTTLVAVGGCFLATGVAVGNAVASIDSPTQFTLTSNATASGTVGFTAAACSGDPEHADIMQTGSIANGILYNITANDLGNTSSQGFFADSTSGLVNYAVVNYLGYSGSYNLTLGDTYVNLFMLNNSWSLLTNITPGASMTDVSMVNNTCTTTAGTNAGLTKRGGTC